MLGLSDRQKQLGLSFMAGRTTLACGAIRSGKTVAAVLAFGVWAYHFYEDHDFAVCVRTDRQFVNPILAEWRKWLGVSVPLRRRQTGLWEFPSRGGAVNRLHRLIGSDAGSAEKAYGMTLAGALVDEWPKQPEDFVSVVHGRCSVPGAKVLMTANPEGPLHWAKTEWVDKAAVNGFGLVEFGLDDNPVLDVGYKAAIRRQYMGVMAARLLEGKWAAATGMVYPAFGRAVRRLPAGVRPVGWDVGLDVASATVTHGLLIATLANGVRWVVDEWRHDGSVDGQLTEDEQARRMVRRWPGWPIRRWYVDPAADSMQVILRQAGLRAVHGVNDVMEGIQAVGLWLADRRLFIDPACKGLIREGGSYAWDEKAAERSQDRPSKGNDHGLDALRYAVATMARTRPAVRRGVYQRR